ncbi:MAG: GatB/YqeY domain-containing protein [Bacteroidetes bacterium]|nr:GatB/YqeY domain-containing protein [Bacteroidota bacterium]
MSLSAKVNDAIKQAMLAKERERLAALRDIKSKLLLEATSGVGGVVTDDVALKICMKLFKQRMETYDLYVAQGREDLASVELFQAKVIEEYLPKMLSEEEIHQEVLKVIKETGAEGPHQMGMVMGILTSRLAGKADGKVIAQLVKGALTN